MSRYLSLAAAAAFTLGAGSLLIAATAAPRAATGGAAVRSSPGPLDDEGPFPGLAGGTGWINSAPLTADALRGKVVVIDFWAFS
jgi:hypothetical protein